MQKTLACFRSFSLSSLTATNNLARCTPSLPCRNFTCYTHAISTLFFVRSAPAHRHSTGTAATAAKCRDAIHAPATALKGPKPPALAGRAFHSRPELATWGARPLSTTLFPRFSLVPARPRLGPIALSRLWRGQRQISSAPRPSHWPCAVSKSQQASLFCTLLCAVPPPALPALPARRFLSRCLHH